MGSFKSFDIADRDLLLPLLKLYSDNEGSECSFVNLFIWSPGDDIRWSIQDGCLLLRTHPQGGTPCMLMAFAPPERMRDALSYAIEAAEGMGEPFVMRGLPEWYCDLMRQAMPDRFAFTREPHHDDYVYETEKLITLAGKKLHQKRNHINKFVAEYQGRYTYEPYAQGLMGECMEVYSSWLALQDDPAALEGERLSVERALANADALGAVGGVIRLDGRVSAFSIGERITENMALIHIEKALPDVPGLFAVMNQEFAKNAFSDMEWINREEDMGSEGLRRAKRSYQPARMIEKYGATLL